MAKAGAASSGPPPADAFERAFRDPQQRDARGYILPSDQPDFLTAHKFVGSLLETGVTVLRATAGFTVQGRRYPAGSFVVKTAQAFRPHVLDMFEPQEHPNDVVYPGGPPVPPYDNAGWTLAFQMGVKFDRVLDGFDGPFEIVTSASPPPGAVREVAGAAGYLISHHQNDAFVVANRLLRAGAEVYWPADRSVGGAATATGAMFVPATSAARAVLDAAAAQLGLPFTGVAARPVGAALRLRPARVALWDRYGGASSSGWIRWLLERYEFPFDVVYPRTLDDAGLAGRFDVLILPSEAAPAGEGRRGDGPFVPEDAPEEFRRRAGAITWARTVPRLKQFVEAGGTLVLIGRAAAIAERLGIGVTDALVETQADGTRAPLPRDLHYVPGSVLRVAVDNTSPLGYGFEREVDVFFDDSPAFRLEGAAARRVAWYPNAAPLRSGWALGQRYLNGQGAAIDAPLGRGRVIVFGPEITYRAQSHGTFKFLFNAIYYPKALIR
jgi:hypothetical protein